MCPGISTGWKKYGVAAEAKTMLLRVMPWLNFGSTQCYCENLLKNLGVLSLIAHAVIKTDPKAF